MAFVLLLHDCVNSHDGIGGMPLLYPKHGRASPKQMDHRYVVDYHWRAYVRIVTYRHSRTHERAPRLLNILS